MDGMKPPIHLNNKDIQYWAKRYATRGGHRGYGMNAFKGQIFQKGRGRQRGDGRIGDFFKQYGMPLLKYLGNRGAASALSVGSDLLAGENPKESFKKRGKRLAQDIASDVADRATTFAQTGKGRKRRRGKKSPKTNHIAYRKTRKNKKTRIKKPKVPKRRKRTSKRKSRRINDSVKFY